MIFVESFGVIPLTFQDGLWKVFLIRHRSSRHWSFPKGRGNAGETPEESAKRELKEETGLEVVRFIRKEPFIEHYEFYRKQEGVSKQVTYFAAEVAGSVVLQVEEVEEGKWVSLKEAPRHLTYVEAQNICHALIKELC